MSKLAVFQFTSGKLSCEWELEIAIQLSTGELANCQLSDHRCTNRPKISAIVIPTAPTTSAPAIPTANGFNPTPLNTAKLVFRPTAAIAVPRRICDAQ